MHHETSGLCKCDAHAQAGSTAREAYVTRVFMETAVNDVISGRGAILARTCCDDNWHRKRTPHR